MYQREIYHLVTVANGRDDSAAIVNVFAAMASGGLGSDIRLLNYYHEVPVSYEASISFIDSDSVELAIHENQAVVINHAKSTLIKSKHFPHGLGVHCRVPYINVQRKLAILDNFAYAQIRAERREAVRVKVKKAVSVTFLCGDLTIEGTIVDISGNGISFISSTAPKISFDQPGSLSFNIMDTDLTVPVSFARSVSNKDDEHLWAFQLKPDRKEERIIGQFIYQRQAEIIQELKEWIVIE